MSVSRFRRYIETRQKLAKSMGNRGHVETYEKVLELIRQFEEDVRNVG
jgi:hypothetical protein